MSEVATAGTPAASSEANTTNVVSEGSENTTNEVKADKPTEAQTQAMLKKFKLKVDGEEFEREIDLNDEATLTKELQMSHAAKKRMTEAKENTQKAMKIIKEFEENPESMLKRLGPKGREIAEKFILAQIQDDMLSPEEKEYRDLKKYKEMTEAEKAKAREMEEMSAREKKEFEIAQNFQNTIIEALTKTGLPKSAKLVQRTAEIFKHNLEYGLELSPDDLAAEVKNERLAELKAIIGDSDGETLIKLFGDDVAKKIRKFDVQKLKEKQGQVYQQTIQKEQSNFSKKEGREYLTFEEMKEQARQRAKS